MYDRDEFFSDTNPRNDESRRGDQADYNDGDRRVTPDFPQNPFDHNRRDDNYAPPAPDRLY